MSNNKFIFSGLNSAIKEYNAESENKISIERAIEVSGLLEKSIEIGDYKIVLSLLEALKRDYPKIYIDEEIEYAKIRSAAIMTQKENDAVKDRIGMIQGFIDMVKEEKKQTIVINEKLSYVECKKLMQKAIIQHYEINFDEEKIKENLMIYPFLISENIDVAGNIIIKRSSSMETITLISMCPQKDNDTVLVKFFGEKLFNNNFNYSESFYVYLFISDDKRTYYVFSREDLSTQHYRIKGMLMEISDNIKLGNNATATTSINVILVTSATPDIKQISQEEFMEYVNGFDHEILAKKFLGELRHTKKFEKLLFAWMFSSKYSGYPLHLLWIGSAGTAKSWTLTALGERVFNETVIDCSTSPLKVLIPSYGQNNIEPGFLLRCTRIACVDEFFRAFKRGAKEEESGLLTTLLEGARRGIGSGKHTMVEAKMNSRVLMSCNPQTNLANIGEMTMNLDKAFMSRMLMYNQTKNHVEFVQERRNAIQGIPKEELFPKYDPKLIQMVDYLQNNPVKDIPMDDVYTLYKSKRSMVPPEIAEYVYDSRYDHHLLCLLDGITKYNAICEGRNDFAVTKKDLADAEELFILCITSWDQSAVRNNLNAENKLDLLPTPAIRLYNAIRDNPNQTLYEYNKIVPNSYYWKGILIKWAMIKEDIYVGDNSKRYTVL